MTTRFDCTSSSDRAACPVAVRRPLDAVGTALSARIADVNAALHGRYGSDVSGQAQDFGGMTVNGRLFAAGLLQKFDAAIDARDPRRAIELLVQVAMSDASARETVDAVLANPAKHGYPRSN